MLDKILMLIKQGEGINIEFKECRNQLPKSLFDTVCSFLNRIGGHILLGVKDNGEIIGVDADFADKIKKDFATGINNTNKIAPTFYTSVDEVTIEGKLVLHIQIPCSVHVHRHAGRIFDRNEDADIDITDNTLMVADLYARKQSFHTENRVYPHVTIDDLEQKMIAEARLRAHNQKGGGTHLWDTLSDVDLLKSANLYAKDPRTGNYGVTLAGILLLGSQQLILSVLPQHKTDAIVRIENMDRYDDREDIRTNLIDSFDRLMAFVAKHLNDTFYLEGDQRVSIRNKIFREICSNLLIHREFSNAFPAKLIIESDCVRTENANRPHGYGEINADSFSPFPKNPIISKFFREIGLADELGSGIKNVSKYLKYYTGGKPSFVEGDVFKFVMPLTEKVIPKRILNEQPKATQQDTQQVTQQDDLQDILGKIIAFCEDAKSRAEIQEYFGFKDRMNFTENYLKPLIESGKLVLTIPDKPTSRNQKYLAHKKY